MEDEKFESKLKPNLNEKELLDLIHNYSDKILADIVRIERNWNAETTDNAQYWLNRRMPTFVDALQAFLKIQEKKDKPF